MSSWLDNIQAMIAKNQAQSYGNVIPQLGGASGFLPGQAKTQDAIPPEMMKAMMGDAMGKGPSQENALTQLMQQQQQRQALGMLAGGGGGQTTAAGLLGARQGMMQAAPQTIADAAARRSGEVNKMQSAFLQSLFNQQRMQDQGVMAREKMLADLLATKTTGQLQRSQAASQYQQQLLGAGMSAAGMGLAAMNNGGQAPAGQTGYDTAGGGYMVENANMVE